MRFRILLLVFSCLLISIKVNAQTASFNAPDTVCRGQNITINNTSTGQSTNLWNFCKQSPSSNISGVNLGNLGVSQRPGYIQIYKDGTSYYGFVGNEQNGGAGLVRLNFGNSILNTPTSTLFSTFSGQLDGPKGMQFFNENGNWYAIVVADNWNAANDYVLVRLDFGNSLSNNPTITNFGDLGGVINEYISDIEIRKTSDGYIGFISSVSGKLFRINFGNSILNTPTAINLGIFGAAKPTVQISLLFRKNNWFLYFPKDDVTPSNCSVGSLNFGASLLNTPTYTNYGNPNSLLNRAYDFLPFVDCDNLKGYVLAPGANKIIEYSFPNDIYSTSITGRDIGNIATFNFPSAFSEPIIFSNEKYVFVTNQISNTISRLKLSNNCSSFGVASSILTNPPVFHIDSVGTYNVSLVVNENLATEARFCKEIVVVDSIKKPDARINTITCSTDSIRLTVANIDATATYSWIGPNGFTSTRPNVSIKFSNANQAGQYIVTAIGRCGTKKDTVSFVSPTGTFVNIGKDTSICQGSSVTLNATTSGTTVTYLWNNGAVTPTISVNQAGTYWVKVTADGCSASDTIRVTILTPPTAFSIGNDTTYCGSFSRILSTGNANTVWSTGVTAAQITVTQPNTYIATITNSCGTKKDTIVINQNNIPLINIGKDTSICQGNTVTLNATTSGTTVTYLWNNGAVTPTISVNQAGTYFVKVTADGCSASDTIRVTILTPPTAFSIGNDTTYCGSFSRILSTGNANTVWSTGVTAAQITVTQPNTYIATITNSCGTKKDTIVINQNNIPLINLGKDTSICQGNTVTLNATTSGTTVTYLWNNGAVTPTISVNQAGTYFVKVTADGCSASDTIRVTILTPPTAFSIGNDTTYCGSFSRILSTGNASTVWSTGVTAAQITVTQPNTYIATITNSCGTKKDTIVINQNNIPLINLGKDTSICQGNTVTLNATTSGTTVTYLWNNGAVTPTISVNQAGTYFVKVTADGCSASDTIRVTILTPPTAFSIGNDTTYCGSFSRILSTGNANTVWSTGVTAAQITVTQPNTYIATITNSCGTKKDTIVINQNNIPLVNLGRDTSICQGSSVTLNATTSGTTVTYLWNNGAVTPTISVNQAGTYWVKVTADGCSASDTIRVTILTPPTAFSIGNDTTYCGSFSRILSTRNASTVWSTGVTAAQITVTQPNTYIATITNSCGTKKDTIVINQNNIPLINLGKDTSICQGNTVTLNATTSGTTVTYLWNNGAVTPTITVNQAGIYFVKVTADGCSASDTIRVTILTPPTAFSIGNDTTYCGSFSRILSTGNANTVWSTSVTAAQITVTQPNTYIATITNSCGTKKDTIVINQNNIPLINLGKDTSICQGSSVTLNATTSGTTVTYLWNNGAVTPTITVNQAGTYFVKVTADGCSASDTIRVTILTPPTAFSIGNDTTYCGSFSRILSTGNANTVWSTGVTAAQITVTQPNTYIATITNSCGTKKDTIVINQNNIPLINLGKDTSICQRNTVTLNATTSGTTVTYLWNNGAVTPTISVNQAGTYFVNVTADGCSASDTIRVTILTPPTAFSIGNDTTYCGSFSRILSTGNANTFWSTGVTAAQITVTQPNTYFATISNSCGSESDSIVITQDAIPTVQINKDTMICGGQPILLTAITNASQFIWNTGETGNSITINQAGKYWVSVTNNTCTAVDTVYIVECEGDLWVPTAFSPNNDGVNDYFKIFGKNVLEYRLLVFDRWGEKLYESNDINISWDGVYKGEVVQLDSYAWVIEYKIILGGVAQYKMKKGTVTVFR